jgi:TRAP-type C4-dicarboxylate transport system substrate-binding protein
MHTRFHSALRGAIATAALLCLAQAAAAAEVTLKAVSGFPKSHENTQSFLHFIDAVNKEGKGVLQIQFVGGPEVTPPPQQPTALRNGLFDVQYGPAAYYLGVFPEGDFTSGFKKPAESRKLGGYQIVDKAMRAKLGATFIARFNTGLGLSMLVKDQPKMRPDGLPDLSGMKIRSSPAYRDFIQELGGTAVVMPISEIYTALERGVVQGAGVDLATVRDTGLAKFLKVRIEPPFNQAGILVIANAAKFDGLPAPAKKLFVDKAMTYEKISMDEVAARETKVREDLDKLGQKPLVLKGEKAKLYVDTYMKTPWGRMKNNANVKVDVEALRKAWY